MTLILPKDGEAILFANFFDSSESDHYLSRLKNEIEWQHQSIKMFGKNILQPRLTALYGDLDKSYRYSGLTMKPKSWTPLLLAIKSRIETQAKVEFTSVLLNQYRNEKDSMGWHRDNEKELGPNPVIGSVSFGATRKFEFRHYFEKNLKTDVNLSHGSFLLMRQETQHQWEHRLAKMTEPTGLRINLTFRILL